MTAIQLPLAAAQPHRNQQLFSDYYLNVILPQRPDWKLLADDAAPVRAQIVAICAAYTPSSNEAQTEDGLIKPVLAALGHTFEVQAALTTPDGTKKPDYVFYRDRAALDVNKGMVLTEDRLRPGAIRWTGCAPSLTSKNRGSNSKRLPRWIVMHSSQPCASAVRAPRAPYPRRRLKRCGPGTSSRPPRCSSARPRRSAWSAAWPNWSTPPTG